MIDISEGKSTPRVLLDHINNTFIIEGQSYPENSSFFYEPIIKWLNEYLEENNREFELIVKLHYINTSSTKALFYIFDLLDEAYKRGNKLKIRWVYDRDNEMARDTGIDLLEDLVMPYEIISG